MLTIDASSAVISVPQRDHCPREPPAVRTGPADAAAIGHLLPRPFEVHRLVGGRSWTRFCWRSMNLTVASSRTA